MKKEKLEEKIKVLQQKNEKHDEGIAKAQGQLKSSKKNLSQEQERADKQVQSTLKDYFDSSSAGGLVDRVLKMEMSEPRLLQLRSTIGKMTSQIDFHRMEKRKNSATIAQLQNQIGELEIKEKIKLLRNHFSDFLNIAQQLETPHSKLRATLEDVKKLAAKLPGYPQKDWTQLVRSNGLHLWQVTVLDSIIPRLTSRHYAELLLQLSLFNDPKNPLYAAEMHRAKPVQDGGIIQGRERMASEYGDYINPAEEAAERLIR